MTSKPYPKPERFETLADAALFYQREPLDAVIRRVALLRLEQFDGHRRKTAKSLGVGVRTLGIWIKQWNQAEEPACSSSAL